VAALHGGMPQGRRNRVLQGLRRRHLRVLVATDVAARGIDVPTISHVINYGLPMKAEDYVHRIGRTGRAGRSGLAVTLAERRDFGMIRRIQRFTTQRIPSATIEGLEPKRAEPKPEARTAGLGAARSARGRPVQAAPPGLRGWRGASPVRSRTAARPVGRPGHEALCASRARRDACPPVRRRRDGPGAGPRGPRLSATGRRAVRPRTPAWRWAGSRRRRRAAP
jgi:superfamily II DNA/RNA helicase